MFVISSFVFQSYLLRVQNNSVTGSPETYQISADKRNNLETVSSGVQTSIRDFVSVSVWWGSNLGVSVSLGVRWSGQCGVCLSGGNWLLGCSASHSLSSCNLVWTCQFETYSLLIALTRCTSWLLISRPRGFIYLSCSLLLIHLSCFV